MRGGERNIDMRLASGLEIPEPMQHLEDLRTRWYPLYDGSWVEQDNELRSSEIALCVCLNSRISGNTVWNIWERLPEIQGVLLRNDQRGFSVSEDKKRPFRIRTDPWLWSRLVGNQY